MSQRQTMFLGDTLLELLFRFIVSKVYGAYLPRSYVGSDALLRQHFPEIIIIIIIIICANPQPLLKQPHIKAYNRVKNRKLG